MYKSNVKTSQSHPLRINTITLESDGKIGLTFCPGKKQKDALSGEWCRNLDSDLQVIRDFGAKAFVSLLEEHEFIELDVRELPGKVKALNIDWYHLPIKDVSIPDIAFEEEWVTVAKRLHNILSTGGKLLLHCKGGLGRTGLVAAKLLVETGVDPLKAIQIVRNARPGSIETIEQLEYFQNLK